MPEIIIPTTLFASIFGIVYVYLMTRNKERLAMIEKGLDVSQLKKNPNGSSMLTYWVIKLGFLMVGLALGIFVGSIFEGNLMGEESYPSMILFFGGLALIASHFVEKNLRDKEKDKA